MGNAIKDLCQPIVSLRLTVVLMAMSIVLIFSATWAQIDNGIWFVVEKYFRSFVVWVPLQIFLPRPEIGEQIFPGAFPWPGGTTLGLMLLINLLAAHAVRFKLTLKRSGIILIHTAIILLLVGEGITGAFALETQMPIYEGQTTRWAHDIREVELAVINHASPEHDQVLAINQSALEQRSVIDHVRLPFQIRVERFMPNAIVQRRIPNDTDPPQADHGLGVTHRVIEQSRVTGVGAQSVNIPAVIIQISRGDESLGRFVLSPLFRQDDIRIVGQRVQVEDQQYHLYLRFRRYYKPYAIRLNEFSHDRYTGTTIAKNFSSDIHLSDPTHHEDRNILIYMNHPLRYHGETFYQANWLRKSDDGPDFGTVLQVVDNPAWQTPYIACLLAGVGMLIHFGMTLIRFLRHQTA